MADSIVSNVFKFVVIRPPLAGPTNGPRSFGNPATEQIVLGMLEQRMEPGVSLERARILVTTELVAKPTAFGNHPEWKILRAARGPMLEALRASDAGTFVQTAEAIFSVVSADTGLPAFLASQLHASLLESLWLGYYASVLDSDRNPDEREEVLGWLRFFYLAGLSREVARLAEALPTIERMRVSVPAEFFLDMRPEQRAPSAPGSGPSPTPGNARLLAFQLRKKELREVLDHCRETFSDRQRTFEQMLTSSRSPKKEDRRVFRGPRAATPWRITDGDFANKPYLLQRLRDYGFEPQLMSYPELIHALQTRLAALVAEQHRFATPQSITFADRILVRAQGGER